MSLGLFVGCGNDNGWTLMRSSECREPLEMSDIYWDNYQISTIAYEEVIKHFTTTDDKYTDDFEGVFIDNNGISNICQGVNGNVSRRRRICHVPLTDFLLHSQIK